MPLFIYKEGTNSIATHLSTICAGAPITMKPTGSPNELLVEYPTAHSPDLLTNPPIGHTLVYALANSSCHVEIWPLLGNVGLPSRPGESLAEEADAALVLFDHYPNVALMSIYYYADRDDDDAPSFTVTVQHGNLNQMTERESPLLMLVHLLAHAYLLVSGQFNSATSEAQALELENRYRTEHSLPSRVDSHLQRMPVYDLGGCGC